MKNVKARVKERATYAIECILAGHDGYSCPMSWKQTKSTEKKRCITEALDILLNHLMEEIGPEEMVEELAARIGCISYMYTEKPIRILPRN